MEEFDFEDGNGPVPARRHPRGGGWVATSAYVHEDAYVEDAARVFGYAIVGKGVVISGDSRISGTARIVSGTHTSSMIVKGGRVARSTRRAWIENYTHYAEGTIAGYRWNAYPLRDGGARLAFGCTERTFDEWDALDGRGQTFHAVMALCAGHDPDTYGAMTRHLVAGLRALWGIPCAS